MNWITNLFQKFKSSKITIHSENNPYLNAKTQWDMLHLNMVNTKKYWRLVSLLSLCANVCLIVGFILLASQSRYIPYAVKVDQLGNTVYAGILNQQQQVTSLEMNAFLRQFIINARSILIDPFAQKQNIKYVYETSSPTIHRILDSFYKSHNPFELAKQNITEIKIHSVLQKSAKTWQVGWNEIVRSLDGVVVGEKQWDALITVAQHPVNDPSLLNENPLGLFVEYLNWNEQT